VRKLYRNGIIAVLAILLIIMIIVNPLRPSPVENIETKTRMIISINFGAEVLKEGEIGADISVMDALKSLAHVETAYNGKFVVSIENISQNSTHSWFYYVNGILANVGAEDYVIHPGDVIRWDFHSWNSPHRVYAELDDFPEPFLHGYDGHIFPTLIVYDNNTSKYAERLKSYFENIGIEVNMTKELPSSSALERDNLIVLGMPEIAIRLNEMHTKLGWTYYVDNGKILDYSSREYRGAFIQISTSPFNPKGLNACENVVMWIYGDDEHLSEAMDSLLDGKVGGFWYFSGEEI